MTTIALSTTATAALPESSRSATVRGLVFDTAVPWAVYTVAIHSLHLAEVQALMLCAAVPMADAARGLLRREAISPVAVLVALGIVCGAGAMLLGGDAHVLLLRESLLSALIGLTCLASLATKRPLWFFFMRYFVAGADPEKQREFTAGLARPGFVRVMRTVTAVWGTMFLVEFAMRAWMVYHLSASAVLIASPILMNSMIGATTAWNIWYGKRKQAAAAARL